MKFLPQTARGTVSPLLALLPVAALLAGLLLIIVVQGADMISALAPYALLGASLLAVIIARRCNALGRRGMSSGLRRSASQVLPAVPMLVCIAILGTTWMMSGVVPTLIDYGLDILNQRWFLVTACGVCALVSVLTGSSWSTIATIGVALMGIGTAMGYGAGWTAGAIISGAYFGDKVSPLSDTTVVASSTCGVDLFEHIRYLMYTTVPTMCVALAVFGVRGLLTDPSAAADAPAMLAGLEEHFNITPWTLVIPALTALMIALRVPTALTLLGAGLAGAVGIFVFQPQIGQTLGQTVGCIWSGFEASTGTEALDRLASTGGILGMIPTICLVLSAMVFGWVMIGTGMLGSIASLITKKLHARTSVVGATVGTGLLANCCTADQYLSLIISGNMFRTVYRRCRLEPRLLSRTIEDSVSITSVLIPWNSCGVTQSAVLGVATLSYLPYCVFNYLSPLMSLLIVRLGFKVKEGVRSTLGSPARA